MRTKCDGKKDTQHKRPKTAALTIHVFDPFAHPVIMLMMMHVLMELIMVVLMFRMLILCIAGMLSSTYSSFLYFQF